MPGPDPISDDLRELIELFRLQNVEFLVVGAHALAFHSRPRFTEDLDLFVRRSPENVRRLRQALEAFGFALTDDAEAKLADDPRAMIVLGRKPYQVDILNFLDGVEFEGAWLRRVIGRLSNLEVGYLSFEDLVATKQATNRPKDQSDLKLLREQNPG